MIRTLSPEEINVQPKERVRGQIVAAEGSKQRIVAVYSETLDKHVYFVTNIQKDPLDAIQIGEQYRDRW